MRIFQHLPSMDRRDKEEDDDKGILCTWHGFSVPPLAKRAGGIWRFLGERLLRPWCGREAG